MTLHTSIATHGSNTKTLPGARPEVPSWEHFTQQGHIGVRGYGHCPAEAFAQTALALIAAITDPCRIQALETLTLECRAPTLELLLLDWLNTLSYEISTAKMLCCAYDVHINGHHLHATVWGEMIDPLRHPLEINVNVCRFSEVRVEALEPDCWLAQSIIVA